MHQVLRISIIVLFLMSTLSGSVSALNTDWKNVKVTVGNDSQLYRTKTEEVGEFLEEAGIELAPIDEINMNGKEKLNNETTFLEIKRGFEAVLRVNGKPEIIEVSKGTKVESLIERLENERDQEYVYQGKISEEMVPYKEVHLSTYSTVTLASSEPVPFETEILLTDELDKDVEEVVSEGVEGEKVITTKMEFIGGVESSRQVINEYVSVEPINKVVKVGTRENIVPVFALAKSNADSTIRYLQEFVMTATAYTAGYESTGKRPGDRGYGITASGMKVRHGVVAVDPRVIPLGTKLYVEGYGEAIAADTGGAIKGNKIDLYYERLDDALRFGRRKLNVYVLEW